jgi:hypothetical protein
MSTEMCVCVCVYREDSPTNANRRFYRMAMKLAGRGSPPADKQQQGAKLRRAELTSSIGLNMTTNRASAQAVSYMACWVLRRTRGDKNARQRRRWQQQQQQQRILANFKAADSISHHVSNDCFAIPLEKPHNYADCRRHHAPELTRYEI